MSAPVSGRRIVRLLVVAVIVLVAIAVLVLVILTAVGTFTRSQSGIGAGRAGTVAVSGQTLIFHPRRSRG